MIVEKEIISGCKKGDSNARQILYERYYQVMFGICLRYVRNIDETKDLVQEGFIKIFTKIKQYKDKGSFEGWMKRIMVNNTIDYIKKRTKEASCMEITDVENNKISDDEKENKPVRRDKSELIKETPNYGMIEDAQFTEDELLRAMHSIPESYSIVFNLHCIEGYNHAEIGKLLDIDEKTSRTRLLRARRYMQEQLYKMCIEKIGV